MKIAIHGRKFADQHRIHVQELFDSLSKSGCDLQISPSFMDILKEQEISISNYHIHPETGTLFDSDLVLSLGGDGTFLETISHVGKKQVPTLGINFGRLGFLANVAPEQTQHVIQRVLAGAYDIEERSLLHVEASHDKHFFEGKSFALNEVAISKTDTSSMIVIHASINGIFLNSYWADGLMVSTPTGSTGYSLSCGGPLVMPQSNNFIITSICPHNLFVRPMIVSDDSTITLQVESRSNNYLVSLDARAKVVENPSIEIRIKKESFRAKLVRLEGHTFLNTLRTKLNWGIDARN